MVALSDLIAPQTQSTITTLQLNMLQLAGFPATSWQSGSVPLSLIQADTSTLAQMTTTVANLAAGGLLAAWLPGWTGIVPPDGWLDLLAGSHYAVTRKPAVATQGLMLLQDVGGGGPYTITVGQLYAQTAAGLQFVNTSGGTLIKGGTGASGLQLSWQATTAGSAANIPNGSSLSLATPLPGVTISNPDPGSGTWITQSGVDAESSASLAARCSSKWATLGSGAVASAYQYWAITSTPTVTRVNVLENTPSGGQVTVVCAGSAGASSSADVASVNAYIQPLRPLCVTVNVIAATNMPITLQGVVSVRASQLAAAQAAFAANVATYASNLPIGATVYLAKLVDLAMSISGVVNVQYTNPLGDTPMSYMNVATFTNNILWSPV